MSSVGMVIAAQPGCGDRRDASTSDYQIILPPLPTGSAVLNTVFLHADIRGRPYRVEDFCDALGHLELLPWVLALGAFQMNQVWAVTFKSPEGKRKTLAAGDLVVKGRRCIVVDPGNRDIRVKLHCLLYHVPDDEVKAALAPYGTVTEMGTEKWRVQGVMDCGSVTRTAVIRLNPRVRQTAASAAYGRRAEARRGAGQGTTLPALRADRPYPPRLPGAEVPVLPSDWSRRRPLRQDLR
ncbi:unnamed protein product [Ixodes pacificus]